MALSGTDRAAPAASRQHDQGRLHKFRWLQTETAKTDPALRPLGFVAGHQNEGEQGQRADEDQRCKSPRPDPFEQAGSDHDDHRRADKGDRHRHEDQHLSDAAPADLVGELGHEKAEARRRRRHHQEPEHVVAHGFPELGLTQHARIILGPHPRITAARHPFEKGQPQRFDHGIGQVEAQRDDRRQQEQPGSDQVGAVDVAPRIRTARWPDHIDQTVGQKEISDTGAQADQDRRQGLQGLGHGGGSRNLRDKGHPGPIRDAPMRFRE